MTKPEPATIVNNAELSQFETVVEGHTAKVGYKLEGDAISFEHTTIPEPLQGRGLAGQLAQASLQSARERSLAVTPVCAVFVNYMKKRPETHDLLSEKGKEIIANA